MPASSSRPFTVLNCDQRSEEWRHAKVGVFSASMARQAFWKTAKGEWRAERRHLKMRLAMERVSGQSLDDGGSSYAMRDGIRREPRALRRYENMTGVVLRSCGFVLDNEAPIGCSPDGVIGDFEGLVQVKCPKTANHLQTLFAALDIAKNEIVTTAPAWTKVVPEEYHDQLRHELYVTGAGWLDFFSVDELCPGNLATVCVRVLRGDADLANYANQVRDFLVEVETECDRLQKLLS